MLLCFVISLLFLIKHFWKHDLLSWTPDYFIHFLFLIWFIFFGSEAIELQWKYSPYSHFMPHNSLFSGLICMVVPFVFMMFVIRVIGLSVLRQKRYLQSHGKMD